MKDREYLYFNENELIIVFNDGKESINFVDERIGFFKTRELPDSYAYDHKVSLSTLLRALNDMADEDLL